MILNAIFIFSRYYFCVFQTAQVNRFEQTLTATSKKAFVANGMPSVPRI